MGFVQGVHRDQITMFPESLDEYVGDDNPVRFIDAFVDSLDMRALGFKHAVAAETGRPPYHPGVLLKLYVYGYLNRIRSSRKLEREAQRNVELMWLLGKLTPDYKTIADFRRDNGQPLRAVYREFTQLCGRLGLYGGELVAIDGSKFKAVNSRDRNYTQSKLKRLKERADRKIEEYLKELDEADEEEREREKPTAEELREKIEWLKRRKEFYAELEEEMEESGESQVSLTDPDARSMKLGTSRGTDVAYNVQISVDAKHSLIVDHEVSNAGNDQNLLSCMALRAKEALEVESLDVVADAGYYASEQIKDCIDGGIVPYVPRKGSSTNPPKGLYAKRDFRYDPENDCYWCPARKPMPFSHEAKVRGMRMRYYRSKECPGCSLQHKCKESKTNRRVWRWVHEDLLDEMERRMRSEPEKVKRRKSVVEHPFGTIKRSMDQGYFLTRRLCNVRAEMSLTMLAYNIKRVIQLLGTQKLLEAVAT